MTKVPFNIRFGLDESPKIDKDFPAQARNSLLHLLAELEEECALYPNHVVEREFLRVAGLPKQEYRINDLYRALEEPIHEVKWWQVFDFIEKVYGKMLTPSKEYDPITETYEDVKSLNEVKEYFSAEINEILLANNLVYQFVDGQFQRRGRAQTQKSIQRVGSILSNPSLTPVRKHYNKALQFFNQIPSADIENCSKEAICALESCLEILTNEPLKKGGFPKRIRETKEIPTTIAESMIKIYAYRGDASGVAHGSTAGSKISIFEAELLLSLVATYITYMADVLVKEEDDVPF